MSDLSVQLREAADQCEGLDEEPTQRLLLDAAARVEEMDVAYGQAVKDLQTNAAMLARQCDLAREAESKAQGYAVAIRDLTSTLARVERERDDYKGKFDRCFESWAARLKERDEARATITDMQRRLDEDHFTIESLTGPPKKVDG